MPAQRAVRSADHPSRADGPPESFLVAVRPKLHRMLRRAGIPEQDADDLIQNTLLALVFQWRGVRNPRAWVAGTLRKNCLMYWRRRGRRIYDAVDTEVLEWLAGGDATVQERGDLRRDLATGLKRIAPRHRRLLRLRYSLGCEPSEVARRMGYRPSSIGKLTARSLSALRRALAGTTEESAA